MSALTMRLLAGLARPDCEIGELASLVEKDTLVSARLLQMANSAKFGRSQAVENIPGAIIRVGLTMMRKLALGVSICNLFSRVSTAPSFSTLRFNIHSVATATLTEILAEEIQCEHVSSAYISGLLHDVGKMLLAVNTPDLYEEILAVSAITGKSHREVELELLGMDHAELSQLAIARWNLSESVQEAVRFHHDPQGAVAPQDARAKSVTLSTVLQASNTFVNSLGMSVLPSRAGLPETPALSVPGRTIPVYRILDRFHDEWGHLNQLFE